MTPASARRLLRLRRRTSERMLVMLEKIRNGTVTCGKDVTSSKDAETLNGLIRRCLIRLEYDGSVTVSHFTDEQIRRYIR